MSVTRVYVARLVGCGVFDPAGDRVGKVIDVLVAYRKAGSPKATGLLIEISGRRRVFVPITRVTSIVPGQVITTVAGSPSAAVKYASLLKFWVVA